MPLSAATLRAARSALFLAQDLDRLEHETNTAQQAFTVATDKIRALTGLRFTEYYRPHGWCWRKQWGGYSVSRDTRAECIAALIDGEIRWI